MNWYIIPEPPSNVRDRLVLETGFRGWLSKSGSITGKIIVTSVTSNTFLTHTAFQRI